MLERQGTGDHDDRGSDDKRNQTWLAVKAGDQRSRQGQQRCEAEAPADADPEQRAQIRMAQGLTLKYGAADAAVANKSGQREDWRQHRKYAEVTRAEKTRQSYDGCNVNKQLEALTDRREGHALRRQADVLWRLQSHR